MKKFKTLLLTYLVWRSLLIVVASISAFQLIPKSNFLGRGFVTNEIGTRLWYWANFDGEHYLWIAQFGYRQYENAFFPLFPMLIRVISWITSDVLLSGIIISSVCSLVVLWLLQHFHKLQHFKQNYWQGLLLFLAFPSAFFLNAVYNESLFLMLVLSAWILGLKGRFWLAAGPAILACATRFVGIFILIPLLIIWYRRSRKISDLIPILLIPSGLLSVMLVNYHLTGDLLGFIHVQPAFGANRSGDELILLPQVLYRYLKILIYTPLSHNYFIAVQELVLTLGALFLVGRSLIKKRWEIGLWSLAVIVLPTLTGTLSSMPRYLLAAVPLIFELNDLLKNRIFYWLVVGVFILLQLINVVLFVHGNWVS